MFSLLEFTFCHLLGECLCAQETLLCPYPGNTNRDPGVTALSSAPQATGRAVVTPMEDMFQDVLWVSNSLGCPERLELASCPNISSALKCSDTAQFLVQVFSCHTSSSHHL